MFREGVVGDDVSGRRMVMTPSIAPDVGRISRQKNPSPTDTVTDVEMDVGTGPGTCLQMQLVHLGRRDVSWRVERVCTFHRIEHVYETFNSQVDGDRLVCCGVSSVPSFVSPCELYGWNVSFNIDGQTTTFRVRCHRCGTKHCGGEGLPVPWQCNQPVPVVEYCSLLGHELPVISPQSKKDDQRTIDKHIQTEGQIRGTQLLNAHTRSVADAQRATDTQWRPGMVSRGRTSEAFRRCGFGVGAFSAWQSALGDSSNSYAYGSNRDSEPDRE